MFPIKPLLSSLIENAKRSVTSSATPPASEGKPKPESNFDTITSKVKPLVANLFEQITKTTNKVISSTEVKKAIELGKNSIQKTGTFIGTTKEDVIDKTKLIKSISEKTITQAKEISTETVTKLKSSTQNFLTSIAKTVNNITESSEVKKALENSKLITKKVTETTVTIKENIIEQTKNLKPKLEEAALEARDSAVKTFGKLKENTSTFLETITKTVSEVATSPEVKKALKTSKTILEKAGETSREIKEGVTSKVEAAKPVVKEAVSKTKDYISESAIKAKETATESFTKLKNTTYSFFDVITKPLKTLAENSQVKEIKNLGEKAFKNTKEIFTSLINEETNTAVKQATDKKKSKKTETFNQQTSEDETVDENSKIILSKKSKRKNNKKNLSENNEQEVENNRRENQEAKNERKSENSAVIEEIAKVLPSQTSKSPDMQSTEVESTTPSETNASLLEAEETAPQEVLFAGFTDRGLRNLKDKLPDIVAIAYNKMLELTSEGEKAKTNQQGQKDDKEPPSLLDMLPKGLLSGLGIIIAGGALVLGGLAALVKGLNTDGPFKGILKILSQGGLIAGIKLLQVGATNFMSALGALAKSPSTLLRMLGGQISRITGMFTAFGSRLMGMFSGGISMITRMLPTTGIFGAIGRVFTNFFAKFASKGFNFIPFIGPIISLGFAFSRLVKGDVVGGLLDVASALVSFIPGIGPVLGLGISVLNAFLDFKGGGSKPGATEKKTGILTGWLKGLGNLILKGAMLLPIIGPGIRAVKAMIANDYGEGLKQLAYIIPGVELIGALFGDKNVSGVTAGAAGIIKGTAGFLGSAIKWIGKMIYGGIKMLPIIGPALKAIESFATGDFLRGIKQIAYIVPGFELIGGFFGDKDVGAVGTIGRAAGGLTKWLAGFTAWLFKKIYSGIKHLPVVGPVFKAIENFVSGDFLKGLKQLAYIFPPFEMIGALFGDQETGGVARVAAVPVKWMGSLIAWVSKTILSGLKLIPIIGPAISAIGEFVSGNFLKGLKQLAYIFPPFELLGGLLGDKEAGSVAGKVGGGIGTVAGWIGSLAKWALKKIVAGLKTIPIIGPAISAIGEFVSGNFLKGLKQLAYIFPPFELLGGLLGDKEAGSVAGKVGGGIGTVAGWIGSLAKWALKKIVAGLKTIPIIGPAISAIGEFVSGNFLKGLKQLAYIYPPFELLGGLLGDKEAGSAVGKVGNVVGDWIKSLGEWISEKILNLPLIGPLIKGIKLFFTDPLKALKTMALGIPILGSILSFLGVKEESEAAPAVPPAPKSPFAAVKDMILEKARAWWKGTWGWVRWLAKKVLPENIVKALEEGNLAEEDIEGETSTQQANVDANNASPQPAESTPKEAEVTAQEKEQTASIKSTETTEKPESSTKETQLTAQASEQPKSFVESKIDEIKQQVSQNKDFKVNSKITGEDYLKAASSFSDKQKQVIEKINDSIGPKTAQNAMLAAVALTLKKQPSKEVTDQLASNNSKVTPNSSLVPQTKQETQTDTEKTAPSTSQQPEQKTKPAVVSKIEKTQQPKSFIETKIEAIKQQSNQDKNFKVNNRIAADDYIVAVNSLSDKNKKIIEKINSSIGPKAAELAMLAAVTLLLKTKPAKELAEQKSIFNNSKESTTVQQTENNFNTENSTQTSENKNVENVSAVTSEQNNTMSATPEGVVESKEEMPSVTSDSSIHSPMVNADGKSDTLLAKIATNSDTANQNLAMLVHGFNNLAKALGQLGVSIAENPGGNTFVNARTGTSSNEKAPARTTEMAKNGNQEIAKFRMGIEQMRQRPA